METDMNQQIAQNLFLPGKSLTLPITSLEVVLAHIYIPRAMYRRTSLIEAVDDEDLQVFGPEFRDKLRRSINPTPDLVTEERPLGPKSVKVYSGPPVGAEEMETLLDLEVGQLESKVRGHLSESASLVQELVPLNFRKAGSRGERQLSREEESTSWEQIRRVQKSASISSEGERRVSESFSYAPGAVSRDKISLSRVIWDPQPFLLVLPQESVFELLSTCGTALQIRGCLATGDGQNIHLQARRWASLKVGGAFLEVKASLPLEDLGSWPTIESLQEASKALGSLAHPGREAVEVVLDGLKNIMDHGEDVVWWVPSLPARD